MICQKKYLVVGLSEGDQPWDFFGGNDAEAETPVLWPPSAKSWLIVKDSDAGRDWGQEEKGTTEDEMTGWHHSLDGRESEWTLGVGDGQGGLACCDSWGRKESDMTERLNWTEEHIGLSKVLDTCYSLKYNWGSGHEGINKYWEFAGGTWLHKSWAYQETSGCLGGNFGRTLKANIIHFTFASDRSWMHV